MLCLRYTLPVFTKRLEPIKIPRKTSAVVVCGAKGPRPRYPRVWKSRNRIGTISKSAKLVECVKGLSNVKEEVYGALDSFIAWELEFPLITVKKALKTLENEREWKRIIQVTKWMLSKGQGKTMGSYFTLLNALAEDGRLDEAEELWTKLFSENLESMPRVFYDKMISIYYHRDMHEKMFEIFADMEELGVKPNTSIVNMVGNVFKKLEMLDKYEKLLNKYPPPEWEYRYIKGKRVRIRAKHLNEFNAVDDVVNEVDGETSQNPDEVYGDETNKNSKEAGDETSQNSDEVDDETSRNPNELEEEIKASSNELSIGIEDSY